MTLEASMSLLFLSLIFACEYDGCLKQDVNIYTVDSDEVGDLVCTTVVLVSGEPSGTKLQVFYDADLDRTYANPVDLLVPNETTNMFVVIDGVMNGSSAIDFDFIDADDACATAASIAWMVDADGTMSDTDTSQWDNCGHVQYVGEDYFTFPSND